MRQVPPNCPKCKEPNIHNLDYCAVCGIKFSQKKVQQPAPQKKGEASRDQKLKLKRAKKRKELTELFKRKKITVEQYSAGLRKLGYATNADKAEAFKKYIREQIRTFEEMELDPNAPSSGMYHDPNESQTDLPRDEHGNVIIDFTAAPDKGSQSRKPTEEMVIVDHGNIGGSGGAGPRFGTSLFGDRGPSREERVKRTPEEKPKMFQEPVPKERPKRKIRALADWDDEEEDIEDEEIEEEEFEGETGWWDDEGWSLEWTDEDEDEFDDFEMDLDDMEDDGDEWILEFDDDEDDDEEEDDVEFEEENGDFEVEFEDDEDEEESEEEEDETSDINVEFDDDDEDDDEEEEDDDWGTPKRRRRRNR